MSNIQDPKLTMDCFACRGKGRFLLIDRNGKDTIYRVYDLENEAWLSHQGLGAARQVDCGECGGTGKISLGEVKY